MPIIFKTLYVFKTPFYEPKYKEFHNILELKNFLQTFDFMKPHAATGLQTGLPEFQLGVCIKVASNEYSTFSNIKWGPRFIVARSVKKDEKGHLVAEIPMDAACSTNYLIHREYKDMPIRNGMADAFIDLKNLKQVWPKCETPRSELQKFFTQSLKHKQY